MSDLHLLFSDSYGASTLAYATAFTAVLVLVLGTTVLIRHRASTISVLFFAITAAAGGWLGSFAMMYAAEEGELALVWGKVGNFSASLIPAAIFHFAAIHVHKVRPLRRWITACWLAGGVIGATGATSPLFLRSVRTYVWGYYPSGTPYNLIWVGLFIVIIGSAMRMLWNAYRTSEGRMRERSGALLLAFAIGSLGIIDYLPTLGVDIHPVGHITMLAFVIIAAATVRNYELLDVTPEFAASQIMETMKGAVVVADMEGKIRVANRAAGSLLGYDAGTLIGRHVRSIIAPDSAANTGQFLNSTGVLEQNMVWLGANGTRIDVLASSSFVRGDDGSPVAVVYVASDYTERKRAEEALKESEHRYRRLFERNLAGVYRTSIDGRFLDCNDALAKIFGYAGREALLAQPVQSFYFDDDERQRLVQILHEQGVLNNIEVRMRRRDGHPIWVIENVTRIPGERGDADVLEGTIIDITEQKNAQERMEYQAYHDVLTGLPNRLLFRDRISIALAQARRHKRTAAVMFLDLDQFKLVNDTLGHTVGDRLLQLVAQRLVACVRADDTVSRMGGDEFTILLSDISERRAASTVAQKVIDAIRQPLILDSLDGGMESGADGQGDGTRDDGAHELFVTTSIGIAIFPEDGTDSEMLLKNADRAMYRAKELGRNNYQYSTPSTFDRAEGRLALERSLHRAIEREQFVVYYQPMVEIASGRVVGAEALVRWNHPEHGLVLPDDFIPLAEECQLIVPLGEWVLRTACAQMKQWHDGGHAPLRIAVNLSPRQFQQRDLVAMVERALDDAGLPASSLDLEITESTAMQNAEHSLAILNRLKEMGIRISIDDFGTGYSSLSYLKRFPIDTVKIDQNFVRDLAHDASDAAIITAVISLARALELEVVAEGVETLEQLAFLRREQCGMVQGFLHSRPLSAEDFERTLLQPDGVSASFPRIQSLQ